MKYIDVYTRGSRNEQETSIDYPSLSMPAELSKCRSGERKYKKVGCSNGKVIFNSYCYTARTRKVSANFSRDRNVKIVSMLDAD